MDLKWSGRNRYKIVPHIGADQWYIPIPTTISRIFLAAGLRIPKTPWILALWVFPHDVDVRNKGLISSSSPYIKDYSAHPSSVPLHLRNLIPLASFALCARGLRLQGQYK